MGTPFVTKELDKFIPIEDAGNLISPRIKRMIDVVQQLNDAGLRKTRLYTNVAESLKTSKGEPQNIRRAKALVRHLENIDLPVYEAEQLIGSVTGMWPVDTERDPSYEELREEAIKMLDEYFANRVTEKKEDDDFFSDWEGLSFEEAIAQTKFRFGSLMARDHYDANITFLDMQKLIADMTEHYRESRTFENWEIGAAIERHFQYYYGDEVMELLHGNGWNTANHTNLNYTSLVNRGLGDVISEIEDRLSKAEDQEKKDFYLSCKIAMTGISDYIKRYSQATREAVVKVDDEVRKSELLAMADVMEKVSTEKPDNFTEAIELVWLIQLVGNLFGGSALSLGRFDQYMYPFYKRDIESGAITLERVRELISSLYLKLNEPRMRTVQSMCVGGVDVDSGEESCNDLSKICLETMACLKLPYPNMSARVMPEKTPDWFYEEIVRTIKAGCGQPMLLNDAVWIPNLTSLGMPEEWARAYYNMGCTEIMIEGKDSNWTSGGLIFFPEILNALIEKAVNEKCEYASFDDFMSDYLEMIEKKCDESGVRGRKVVASQRRLNCDPFASSLIDGCLESGTDYFKGGSLCGDPCSISAQGLGTAADSLSVIRKFVFDEKKYTLEQILLFLTTNFKDNESVRRQFINGAPMFGNDDDYVDELAKQLFDTYSAGVRKQNEDRLPRMRFVNNVFSYNMHITLGESLDATANGRFAGEAISDCVGPSQGSDIEGVTAFLNSALKLSPADVTGAHALNLKINPSLAKDKQGTAALINMLKVYIKEMGPQIQLNYQNPEDLLDAQKHPEKHRNLVVRIAGYCEYFINLDRRLQSEIIERSMHGVM